MVVKPQHIVGLLIIVGAIGYMIFGGLGQNLVYFVTPSEYFQQETKYQDRPVRLGGIVKEGTVQYNKDTLVLNFTLTDYVKEIPIQHQGTPPALFKERQGVVVEGKFIEGQFTGNNLLVKHSEAYTPPAEGTTPEEIRKLIEEAQ